MNAERAAQVISNKGTTSDIQELSLVNGETYTAGIQVDGTTPLALTIVWTDPKGTPVNPTTLDNPTLMLVNDLDVRISNGTLTYEPWVMTPNATFNNFTAAAA